MNKKVSKKNRRNNEIDTRINENTTKINKVDNDLKRLKKEYNGHIKSHIIDDLRKKRFEGSDKYLYTYEDIAQKYQTSPSTIARIAADEGLSRRTQC